MLSRAGDRWKYYLGGVENNANPHPFSGSREEEGEGGPGPIRWKVRGQEQQKLEGEGGILS